MAAPQVQSSAARCIVASSQYPSLSAMQKPARFLIIIDAGGGMVARLFDDQRHLVTEIDASTEEVVVMTAALTPERSAAAPEWDEALRGHSREERAAAEVYTLDV